MRKILVTGALGQIGLELLPALQERYGAESVIASDVRVGVVADDPLFEVIDCTQRAQIQDVVQRHDVGTIYHLAAMLSATAEERPQAAWDINMGGVYHVLEVARQNRCAVFLPSSIGAFGPSTPRDATPQVTIQRPTTIYGVTKVASELLCDYYFTRFGVDTRGLRFPGLISYVAPPGGGTTDYAVDIFLPGDTLPALHLFSRRRLPARHDVHARRGPRDDRVDGGRSGASGASQLFQYRGNERDARGVGGGNR